MSFMMTSCLPVALAARRALIEVARRLVGSLSTVFTFQFCSRTRWPAGRLAGWLQLCRFLATCRPVAKLNLGALAHNSAVLLPLDLGASARANTTQHKRLA